MNWNEIKKNYPLVNKYTYLDSARTGAMSRGSADCLKAHVDDFLIDGALHREDWIEVVESARDKVATAMGCTSGDVGFLTDVSTGMSFLATAMKKYRKVLLVRDDFPSVGIPWIRSGYEISWIDKEEDLSINVQKIEDVLKEGIDVLAISWVQYNSGFRIDLRALSEMCQKYNTKFLVDGTQGFCAFPVQPKNLGIDVFMASAFKWMTAGYGVSVMYMDADFREQISFEAGGWNSLVDFFGSWEEDQNYKPDTSFVEIAHPKYANLITLNHALGELLNIGLDQIHQRTYGLAKYLQSRLVETGIETRSNFCDIHSSAIRLMKGDKQLFKKLLENNVMVTFREDYFRVAPHFYNEKEDIDRLIEVCKN